MIKKRVKSYLFMVIIALSFIVGILIYRNVYLKDLTSKNLGELAGSVKNGVLKDYHNTIDVDSISDIHYVYDLLFGVYKLYYGNYTIYLSVDEDDSWSAKSLELYLGMIGITFTEEDGSIVFYYFGEEIATEY